MLAASTGAACATRGSPRSHRLPLVSGSACAGAAAPFGGCPIEGVPMRCMAGGYVPLMVQSTELLAARLRALAEQAGGSAEVDVWREIGAMTLQVRACALVVLMCGMSERVVAVASAWRICARARPQVVGSCAYGTRFETFPPVTDDAHRYAVVGMGDPCPHQLCLPAVWCTASSTHAAHTERAPCSPTCKGSELVEACKTFFRTASATSGTIYARLMLLAPELRPLISSLAYLLPDKPLVEQWQVMWSRLAESTNARSRGPLQLPPCCSCAGPQLRIGYQPVAHPRLAAAAAAWRCKPERRFRCSSAGAGGVGRVDLLWRHAAPWCGTRRLRCSLARAPTDTRWHVLLAGAPQQAAAGGSFLAQLLKERAAADLQLSDLQLAAQANTFTLAVRLHETHT